jgi:hypothetical protein
MLRIAKEELGHVNQRLSAVLVEKYKLDNEAAALEIIISKASTMQ